MDNIAFGLQKFIEELLVEWVKNAIDETQINNIIMSGGVALNVKANKCIWELDEVSSLNVPPGPNDESLSILQELEVLHKTNSTHILSLH